MCTQLTVVTRERGGKTAQVLTTGYGEHRNMVTNRSKEVSDDFDQEAGPFKHEE